MLARSPATASKPPLEALTMIAPKLGARPPTIAQAMNAGLSASPPDGIATTQ